MQSAQTENELYAITKAIADYVHPFTSALGDCSTAEFELVAGMTEKEKWYVGLVTREPGTEGYGLKLDRRVVVCLHDPQIQNCRVFSGLYTERYRLNGVVCLAGETPDSADLTERFMEAVYSVTSPFEKMVQTALSMMERDPQAYPTFPITDPRDLYAFLTRTMVSVMQSMPDSARKVVEDLGFVGELSGKSEGQGWERFSLKDFQEKLLEADAPKNNPVPPNCFSLAIQ